MNSALNHSAQSAISVTMDNSSASQSATKVVEDTATPKMQPPGKTVPSLADRTIPPENLGIKIRFKPINEEDINIEYGPIYGCLVSSIALTRDPSF